MKEIPEWFFELKRKIWYKLGNYVGKVITEEDCKAVEKCVNEIIDEQDFTYKGRKVSGVSITYVKDASPKIIIY